MSDGRQPLRDSQPNLPQAPALAIFSAESLRAGQSGVFRPSSSKSEDKLSLFWRVFGGTLISIAGLVGVTVYQQFNNNMNEIRNEITQINAVHADFIKKDEFNSRSNLIWNSLKEMHSASTQVSALQERSHLLEQQLKSAEEERRTLTKKVAELSERLAGVEGSQRRSTPAKDEKGP
ncbi:MAG TPA: hypothetical protein VGZ25_11970 [Gemmataceae bacterium]|nr:hypothetical protein [Gemmataceae bacterium]